VSIQGQKSTITNVPSDLGGKLSPLLFPPSVTWNEPFGFGASEIPSAIGYTAVATG
jgi:hypothetical protein